MGCFVNLELEEMHSLGRGVTFILHYEQKGLDRLMNP